MANKYSGRLFPVEAGQVIIVSGRTSANAERFEIELTSESGHGVAQPYGQLQTSSVGDIQFHLSARFAAANVVVRNAHTRGVGWGHEERHENMFPNNVANPLRPGSDFKVAIYIDASMFFISINEKPFCMFPHRKPLHEIHRININRDVESIYQVDHITTQHTQWPALSESSFSGLVPKQFSAGSVIVITAVPRGNRGDFNFDLRESGTKKVLFHLRPYISNGAIATNDQDVNGGWRQQLNCNPSPFPFMMEQRFKLAIAFSNHSISIAVNGRTITSFPYRDGAHKVFGSASGFKIGNNNGLRLEIQVVDHMTSDANCHGFERLSC